MNYLPQFAVLFSPFHALPLWLGEVLWRVAAALTLAGGLRLVVSQRLLPSVDRSRMYAAAELLPGSVALWSLIRDNKTFQIPSLQQRGKALGILRLDDALAELVKDGKVALDDAMPYAEAPDLLAQLAGKPGHGKPAAAAPVSGPWGNPGTDSLRPRRRQGRRRAPS